MDEDKRGDVGVVSRRETLAGLLALGGSVLAGCGARRPSPAMPTRPSAAGAPPGGLTMPRGPVGAHTPVPLPFAPASLNGLSERLIVSHHDKNYGGAVRNLNRVEHWAYDQIVARVLEGFDTFIRLDIFEDE